MRFDVFTPSFNKMDMVRKCIDSVMNQSHKDFVYWIIENSTDPYAKMMVHSIVERYEDPRIILIDEYPDRRIPAYVSSVYMNKYLEYMKGGVVWLSDDDYLYPNALEEINKAFESNPEASVVYWGLQSDFQEGESFVTKHIRYAKDIVKRGTNVDCMLDGGQICHKVECVKKIEKPYWREIWDNDTAHCDGIFFNRLVMHYDFHPIDKVLSVKRTSNISNFTKK